MLTAKNNTCSRTKLRSCGRRWGILFAITVVLSGSVADGVLARNWALVIGTDNYDDATHWRKLPFVTNDVTELESTLIERGNYPVDQVLTLLNKNGDELSKGIEKFLNRLTPDDQLLVYFTGHGHRTND